MRLFFLTIPKPLKQHPILKKDHPFRSPSRRLIFKDLEEKLPERSSISKYPPKNNLKAKTE
jgi:hypothetical protein